MVGTREHAEGEDVGRRRDDRRHDDDDEHRPAELAQQEARAHHADRRQHEDEDRQLEHQRHAEDDGEQEAQVARPGDRRLEVLADVDQELDGVGKRHVVGEHAAGEEEERAEER